MKKMLLLVMCCLGAILCSCCASQNINTKTVPYLDLSRYLGRWYEIARYNHRFERCLTNCTADYVLNDDGTICVMNSGWEKGKLQISTGHAKTTSTPGLFRVSFFGPFYSDYRILMLDEDYTYALVGSDSDKYLWILSRTPSLPMDTVNKILREAAVRGYDTTKLIWVEQNRNK